MLTLYVDGYFTSVWDASVIVALREKDLEFSTARALLRDGQGVPPALRDKAAIGRIPALQHGDVWLTESLAIIEYLEDVFPHPRVLPAAPAAKARARQVMAWLRSDLWALRTERPWQQVVYPGVVGGLSPRALVEMEELTSLAARLDDEWNISHADLGFALLRLSSAGDPLPPPAQRLVDAHLARPSVRWYLEHPRPPYPPPAPRS